MYQGQDAAVARGRGPARRLAIAVCAVAVLVPTGLVGASTAAGAAGAHQDARSAAVTTTTVVSPTTTVVTTRGRQSVTTSTTTVTTTPTAVTTTTVTTVAPTTTTTTKAPVAKATTTTTTKAPVAKATTTTTTTRVPVATTTTTSPGVGTADRAGGSPATTGADDIDTTCSGPATPELQDYLDSLPAGSVFQSSTTACYEVPDGIVLTKPITIVGGTFYDPSTSRPTGPGWDGMKPIILVKEADDVTLTGVSVLGANAIGGFHHLLVGEAGFKVESSDHVTLTDDSALDTWGDGLELVANFGGHDPLPVTGLTVNGFTTTRAGRQGVTLAEVSDSSLNDVNVVSPADAGFDFESDLPGEGSSNVSITNCADDKGFNMVEYFAGPVTISGCTGFHHVTLRGSAADAPISFVGGTLTCKRDDPQPCIDQDGGSLDFTDVAIDRMAGTIAVREPAWSVDGGGHLQFVDSPIQSSFGSETDASTVRFVK